MKTIDVDKLKEAIDNSKTMAEAAKKMGLSFSTFKRAAEKNGFYIPNQGRKGVKREAYENESQRIPLEDILKGLYPFYSRKHLKTRLLIEGIKKNECEECGLTEWRGKEIVCQLDHIDGNASNHKLENLKILCPNCHSQTETHSGKNRDKHKKYSKIEFITAVESSKNFVELKKKLGLVIDSPNQTYKNLMLRYNVSFSQK